MQDEAKIQALLQSNTPENQKIAIQLIQNQWGWTLEKAFDYAIEFYCKTNAERLFLYIGKVVLTYTPDHYKDADYSRYAYIMFKMREDNIIKKDQNFAETILGNHDSDLTLADYLEDIKTHFKELLPTISQD